MIEPSDRQTRFAHTTRTGQRHQPAGSQDPQDLAHFVIAAHTTVRYGADLRPISVGIQWRPASWAAVHGTNREAL